MLKFVGVKQPTNLVNDETFDVFRTRVRLPPTPPFRFRKENVFEGLY